MMFKVDVFVIYYLCKLGTVRSGDIMGRSYLSYKELHHKSYKASFIINVNTKKKAYLEKKTNTFSKLYFSCVVPFSEVTISCFYPSDVSHSFTILSNQFLIQASSELLNLPSSSTTNQWNPIHMDMGSIINQISDQSM